MTSPMRLFRRSDLSTHCEQCKLSYDLTQMGACRECRRVLCNTHLHGSFWQRLKGQTSARPRFALGAAMEQLARRPWWNQKWQLIVPGYILAFLVGAAFAFGGC